MPEPLKKKIYISPQSGTYANRLLVLDHVESMSHLSNAVITSHPIESQNQNIADHRYHTGKIISLTGMVSNSWETPLSSEPTPIFQSVYFKASKRLRDEVTQVEGSNNNVDPETTKYVGYILDGAWMKYTEKDLVENVPENEYHYIALAERIVSSEEDMVEEANNKGMSIDKDKSNSASIDGAISTISEAKELLKYVDNNNIIVTIQSVWDEYPDMVLKSFNNVLRNGPQRGAYWVNLVFEEEMISEEAQKVSVVSVANSEEVSNTEDKGPQEPTVAQVTDENLQAVKAIYIEVLNQQVSQMSGWIALNPNSEKKILEDALAAYMGSGSKNGGQASTLSTSTNINSNMQIVASYRGKTPW